MLPPPPCAAALHGGDVGAAADDEALRQRCEQSGSRCHRRLVAGPWNGLESGGMGAHAMDFPMGLLLGFPVFREMIQRYAKYPGVMTL